MHACVCVFCALHKHLARRAYMYLCMHICTYIVYVYISTYTYTHTHTHEHKRIHTCKHTYIQLHTNMYTFIHIYMYTFIHSFIHTFIHTFIHSYRREFIHTYTHTYMLFTLRSSLMRVCAGVPTCSSVSFVGNLKSAMAPSIGNCVNELSSTCVDACCFTLRVAVC